MRLAVGGPRRSGYLRINRFRRFWTMRSSATCLILTLAMLQPSWAEAGASDPLQDGQYSVDVRLELPHLEDLNMTKTSTVCVTPDHDNRGLAVLSDNNPLSRCPVSNVQQSGNVLTFDIICEGKNQAQASASYVLSAGSFRGRITMRMGGKNMTMAETQVGHRVGACPSAGTPPS